MYSQTIEYFKEKGFEVVTPEKLQKEKETIIVDCIPMLYQETKGRSFWFYDIEDFEKKYNEDES